MKKVNLRGTDGVGEDVVHFVRKGIVGRDSVNIKTGAPRHSEDKWLKLGWVFSDKKITKQGRKSLLVFK
jgi:hypothetical protein